MEFVCPHNFFPGGVDGIGATGRDGVVVVVGFGFVTGADTRGQYNQWGGIELVLPQV